MLNGPLPTGEIEGGVTRWVHELANQLTQLGHEVHIMGYGDHARPISTIQNGLQYHGVSERYFGDNLLLGKWLANHIVKLQKRYKYDLINSHVGHHTFPAILTRKSLKVPVLTTIHAVVIDEFLTCHKEMQTIYGLKFFGPRRLGNALTHATSVFIREYFTYKYSDALITVSQHSLRKLQELYHPSVKTYVVYGGISRFEAKKPLKRNSSDATMWATAQQSQLSGIASSLREESGPPCRTLSWQPSRPTESSISRTMWHLSSPSALRYLPGQHS